MKLSTQDVQLNDEIKYYQFSAGDEPNEHGTVTQWIGTATVIAKPEDDQYDPYFIIGWKENPRPNASGIKVSDLGNYNWDRFTTVQDMKNYTYYQIIRFGHEVVSINSKEEK